MWGPSEVVQEIAMCKRQLSILVGCVLPIVFHLLLVRRNLDLIFRVLKIFGDSEVMYSMNIIKCAIFWQPKASCRKRATCLNIPSQNPPPPPCSLELITTQKYPQHIHEYIKAAQSSSATCLKGIITGTNSSSDVNLSSGLPSSRELGQCT